MKFRTVEISDLRFSPEGLRFITVKSPALGRRADITAWLPPGFKALEELPLVIVLHGVYGSHWAWAFTGGAHRTAALLISEGAIRPMALVMPSDGLWGDGSAYTRHPDADYERWIVEDVPTAARTLLSPGTRTSLFLSGLSMGGFGALRLGAKYGRSVYRAVSAHSSITDFDQMALFVEEPLESYHVPAADRSVLQAILAHRDDLPVIRFDCGVSDPLIEHNRALHHTLAESGVQHTYEEFSGGHEWAYWEEHLADSLRFFSSLD